MKKVLKVRPKKEKAVFENLPESLEFLEQLGLDQENEEPSDEEVFKNLKGIEQ